MSPLPPRLTRTGPPRPEPKADNHLIVITLDSCRYDGFLEAKPTQIARPFGGLDNVERRWTYASWTAPSHYNLLMGLLPHSTPPHVYASEYYKRDFVRYNERLAARDESIDFASLIPSLWLPSFLRNKLGYQTHAMVSLPVINQTTPVNRDFDSFELMNSHNDMSKMLDKMESGKIFSSERPSFVLMNTGETHYPYSIPGDDPDELPRIPGVHGVVRPQAAAGDKDEDPAQETGPEPEPEATFPPEAMDDLRKRQIRAVRHLDEHVFPRLYDIVPENTWIVVTSDHGELFGENGYFGHGPILHEKVLEVPFLEGKVR